VPRLIAALVAASLAASAAVAQPVPEPPPSSYALVQMSVTSDKVTPAEFRKRTAAIRSCEDAVTVAGEIGAAVVRNARVAPERLPPQLRTVLKDLPVGHATQVFAGKGLELRVLVLCART